MAGKISIAILQLGPVEQHRRADRLRAAVEAIASESVDLILVPELSNVSAPFSSWRNVATHAEDLSGSTVTAWLDIAKTRKLTIVGGFAEAAGRRLYNSAACVDDQGVVAVYRKIHLFNDEKRIYTPGPELPPVLELRFGCVSICICYDLRFVEVLRYMSVKGAQLALVPTAWISVFDKASTTTESEAVTADANRFIPQIEGALVQANLNQMFVAIADRAGVEDRVHYLGQSLICNPYGEFAAGPSSIDGDESFVAEIDLGEVFESRVRSAFVTPRADRRSDLFDESR